MVLLALLNQLAPIYHKVQSKPCREDKHQVSRQPIQRQGQVWQLLWLRQQESSCYWLQQEGCTWSYRDSRWPMQSSAWTTRPGQISESAWANTAQTPQTSTRTVWRWSIVKCVLSLNRRARCLWWGGCCNKEDCRHDKPVDGTLFQSFGSSLGR